MKRIGLLGGMSWESSAEYYRLINETTRDRCGGLHSADCVLRSVDFAEIEQLQREGDWNRAGERLAREAAALEAVGAEMLVLCTNTMHKVADAFSAAITIPFIHIADTTAHAVQAQGLSTVWGYWARLTRWSRTSTPDVFATGTALPCSSRTTTTASSSIP